MRGLEAECAECGHLRLHHSEGGCGWGGGKCQCSGLVVLLTPREVELVVMMGGGHSNKSMARELGLSIKTIEAHRFNLSQKTGTSSALQLVLLALRSGIVTLGDLPVGAKIAK